MQHSPPPPPLEINNYFEGLACLNKVLPYLNLLIKNFINFYLT